MNSDNTDQMAEKEQTSNVFYKIIESVVNSLTPENQYEIAEKIVSLIQDRSQVPIIMNIIRAKSKTNPTNVQEYIHIVTEIAMNLHLSKEPENSIDTVKTPVVLEEECKTNHADVAGQPVITLVDESNVNRTLSTILEDDEEIFEEPVDLEDEYNPNRAEITEKAAHGLVEEADDADVASEEKAFYGAVESMMSSFSQNNEHVMSDMVMDLLRKSDNVAIIVNEKS